MKHEIAGVIEKDGKRYDYEATVFTGEDADNRKIDEVTMLTDQDCEEADLNGDSELFDTLTEMALNDANERLLYCSGSDAIKGDETLDEYLSRMAKVWHPEELKNKGGLHEKTQ